MGMLDLAAGMPVDAGAEWLLASSTSAMGVLEQSEEDEGGFVIAFCPISNFRVPAEFSPLRCPISGQPLEYTDLPAFDPTLIDPDRAGIWRYAPMLPVLPPATDPVTLGEGWTPLIPDKFAGLPVLWKMDAHMPTGSYKDRGVSVMVNWFRNQGVDILMDDSSGNAGASLACYAARANMGARIFVPASAPEPKKAQIAVYGAELVEVPGSRIGSTEAVEAVMEQGAAYASHAWHPAFLLGQMTVAWEIWEQLGRKAPDWLVGPAGQGGMMLGTWRGFQRLFDAGQIDYLPKMVAVQAEPFTAIYEAFHERRDQIRNLPRTGSSLADGISIEKPVHSRSLLSALHRSGGTAIAVTDTEIQAAHHTLASRGLFVEPTSAAAAAALVKLRPHIKPGETVAVILTGHGLKRPPAL